MKFTMNVLYVLVNVFLKIYTKQLIVKKVAQGFTVLKKK